MISRMAQCHRKKILPILCIELLSAKLMNLIDKNLTDSRNGMKDLWESFFQHKSRTRRATGTGWQEESSPFQQFCVLLNQAPRYKLGK